MRTTCIHANNFIAQKESPKQTTSENAYNQKQSKKFEETNINKSNNAGLLHKHNQVAVGSRENVQGHSGIANQVTSYTPVH